MCLFVSEASKSDTMRGLPNLGNPRIFLSESDASRCHQKPQTTLAIWCLRPLGHLSAFSNRRAIARLCGLGDIRDLTVEDRVDFVGHVVHHGRHDVAVCIRCQRDRAVTEKLHDCPELDALG